MQKSTACRLQLIVALSGLAILNTVTLAAPALALLLRVHRDRHPDRRWAGRETRLSAALPSVFLMPEIYGACRATAAMHAV